MINAIDFSGQSLMEGVEGTPLINIAAINKFWMIGNSIGGGLGAARQGSTPLAANTIIQQLRSVELEGIHAGMGNWLLNKSFAPINDHVFFYNGIGGSGLEDMIFGTTAFLKGKDQLNRAKDFALGQGSPIQCLALCFMGGENHQAYWLQNPPNYFEDLLKKYLVDKGVATKSITGQSEPLKMLCCQTSSHGFYHVFFKITGTITPTPPRYPSASITMSSLANKYPDQFVMVGAKYHLPYAREDSVHLTSAGYEQWGEKYAQVYDHAILQKKLWKPLQMRSASCSMGNILIDFDILYKPLQWNTNIADPGNKGFVVRDANQAIIPILSVAISGDQVKVIVDPAVMPASIEYAWENWNQAALTATDIVRATGSIYGARGQLCDSDPTQSLKGYDLRNHCIHCKIPIVVLTQSELSKSSVSLPSAGKSISAGSSLSRNSSRASRRTAATDRSSR
jgi:hypothetical protein